MRRSYGIFARKFKNSREGGVPAKTVQQVKKPLWRRAGVRAWKSVKRLCFMLGALVLFTSLLGMVSTASLFSKSKPAKLPDEMVLHLKLEGSYSEIASKGGFPDAFAPSKPTIYQIVDALDRASQDKAVKGIYVRLASGAALELSHIQELRAAVKRFQESGKFAHIYSPSYGDGGGIGAYYLASAFKNIWMQPIGTVTINGMRLEMPFARDVLDKLGIQPEFLQRKAYKSAYESLTNRKMSAANREAMARLLDDYKSVISRDIATDRGVDQETVMRLVDQGLFTAKDAKEQKLVTRLGYADIVVGDIAELIAGDREALDKVFVPIKVYANAKKKKQTSVKSKTKIALININGAIMPGDGSAHISSDLQFGMSTYAALPRVHAMAAPLGFGGGVAAADEIAPAIAAAAGDKEIKAIIIRIDSPGGSPTASETILRAMQRAKTKGKTVIVSMGGAAASGGYWIASGGDYILAQPTTLTGSIGVIGGKFALGGLWDDLGVNWDKSLAWGENAGMWSFNTPFTASEKRRIDEMLDQIYDGFIARVAKGRKLSPERVEEIAQGRVWTGYAASQIGLVDELGNLADALNYSAKLNGLESRKDLDIVVMPRPKTAFEQFIELVENGGVRVFLDTHIWFARQLQFLRAVIGS